MSDPLVKISLRRRYAKELKMVLPIIKQNACPLMKLKVLVLAIHYPRATNLAKASMVRREASQISGSPLQRWLSTHTDNIGAPGDWPVVREDTSGIDREDTLEEQSKDAN